MSRRTQLEPKVRVRHYEWPAPGDLLHVDTKKLGRIDGIGKRFGGPGRSRSIGWNWVHLAVDDHSRLAYAEELPDELAPTATAFTMRALAFFAEHGIQVRRLLSDNGPCYRSLLFADTLASGGSGPCAPVPTHPGPTAKPRRCWGSCSGDGPTVEPTRTPSSGSLNSLASCAPTITTYPMEGLMAPDRSTGSVNGVRGRFS
jgi:hypothetical protein